MARPTMIIVFALAILPWSGCDGDDGTDGYPTPDGLVNIPVDLDVVDDTTDTVDIEDSGEETDTGPGLETIPCETDEDCTPTYACHDGGACEEGGCVFSWVFDDGLDCTLDCVIENGEATEVVHVTEGCAIEGRCWDDGEENPDNLCQICEHERVSTNWAPREDGYECDDGDPCTIAETGCLDGVCTGPSIYDDGNACTHDCIVDTNGQAVEITENVGELTACDDGEPCTENDACVEGVCTGGDPPTCDDDNACTEDVCTDGVGCENVDACDDGNPCTEDSCTQDRFCDHNPMDTAECTTCEGKCDTFYPSNGLACSCDEYCTFLIPPDCCSDIAAFCPDQAFCLVHEDCDDGDPCTLDNCDPPVGCVNTPYETCEEGGEEGGEPAGSCEGKCGDYDPNADCQCDEDCSQYGDCCEDYETLCDGDEIGCTSETDCDDAIDCTEDSCNLLMGGCEHEPVHSECDDGAACTTDICDVDLGCQNDTVADGTACEDGDACTENDVCTVGACGGSPLDCDDQLAETEDSCVDGACEHVAQ